MKKKDINKNVDEILRSLRVLVDDVKDFKVVYLYHNGMKVGRMEYMLSSTPYQGDIKQLTSYKFEEPFMELFSGVENPIKVLNSFVVMYV